MIEDKDVPSQGEESNSEQLSQPGFFPLYVYLGIIMSLSSTFDAGLVSYALFGSCIILGLYPKTLYVTKSLRQFTKILSVIIMILSGMLLGRLLTLQYLPTAVNAAIVEPFAKPVIPGGLVDQAKILLLLEAMFVVLVFNGWYTKLRPSVVRP